MEIRARCQTLLLSAFLAQFLMHCRKWQKNLNAAIEQVVVIHHNFYCLFFQILLTHHWFFPKLLVISIKTVSDPRAMFQFLQRFSNYNQFGECKHDKVSSFPKSPTRRLPLKLLRRKSLNWKLVWYLSSSDS